MKQTMMCPVAHSLLSLAYQGSAEPVAQQTTVPASSTRRMFRRLARVAVYAAAALTILVSPVSAEMPVDQTWNAEYGELLGQINRRKESKKEWRDRLSSEALDQQALILTGDTDPLDVVLRRTAALVR